MRVVVTGSSGRIGRAIFCRLARSMQVAGLDRTPSSTASFVGDLLDRDLLMRAFEGTDAVIHTAALHAPQVGVVPDREFERVNVEGVAAVIAAAEACGVGRIVFTSTTALYGNAVRGPDAAWIDETTVPQPVTIYHRTKLAGERQFEACSARGSISVRVLRMSRCFPEPVDVMLGYRLHRGVDPRDVAAAHALALCHVGGAYRLFIVSGRTPFRPEDCAGLAANARDVIAARLPAFLAAVEGRGWAPPSAIDRVYSPGLAQRELRLDQRFGFEEVLAQYDRESPDVLPRGVLYAS